MKCNLCPRNCSVDRSIKKGFCGSVDKIKIANYGLFKFEEPCISFDKGSGAIFFSGCSLKCVYCQNYEISDKGVGKEITVEELAKIFEKFDKTADNINLVNPTHFVREIIEAFKIYKPSIPVVYNTHGYETVKTIEMLEPFVDIYLTDFKYFDSDISLKYSKAENYLEKAHFALKEMVRQKQNVFDENGKMLKGVIVRHLILPNNLDNSKKVLDYLKEEYDDITISLMSQYIPCHKAKDYEEINRTLLQEEYDEILDYAYNLGLDGYAQELSSAEEFYIPKWSDDIKIE